MILKTEDAVHKYIKINTSYSYVLDELRVTIHLIKSLWVVKFAFARRQKYTCYQENPKVVDN